MASAPEDPNRDLGLGSRLAQRPGTRFRDMFVETGTSQPVIDMRRLSEIERV